MIRNSLSALPIPEMGGAVCLYYTEHVLNYLDVSAILEEWLKEQGMLRPFSIEKNEYGKPFIPQYPQVHFNIAHTPSFCAMVVGMNYSLGLDVENLNRRIIAPVERLKKRLLQDDDTYVLPLELKAHEFLYVWTLKEAATKARGIGTAAFKMCRLQGEHFDWRDENTVVDGGIFRTFVLKAKAETYCCTVARMGHWPHP